MKLTEHRHSFRKRKARAVDFWIVECSDESTGRDNTMMGIVGNEAAADRIVQNLNIASQLIMEAYTIKKENPYRAKRVGG